MNNIKKINMMGHIEKIIEISKDSKLDDEFFEKAKIHTNYLKRTLHLNVMQALLFSHFIDRANDSRILISEIADFIGCRTVKLLKHIEDIEALERRRLIRCSRSDRQISYRVPQQVLISLVHNKEPQPENRKNLTANKLFECLAALFEEKHAEELTYDALSGEIEDLMKENSDLNFVKILNQYSSFGDETILFLYFCHLFVSNNDDNIGFNDFEWLFKSQWHFRSMRRILTEGNFTFFNCNLVECVNDNGFEDRDVAQTENAIQNIILQEIENLNGILIATTNLIDNLDKAFERRFLYKIEFSKPGLEAKKAIWLSNLQNISESEVEELARNFDFSGGQIENIVRKATVDSILGGAEPNLEKLQFYCQNEKLTKERPRIGFNY
jgi:hypothetical protein